MANVSVGKDAVKKGIALCDRSINGFKQTSLSLSNKYKGAGATWKDSKYRELGVIVGDCTKALNNPIKELETCKKKLEALYKAIEEYENNKI